MRILPKKLTGSAGALKAQAGQFLASSAWEDTMQKLSRRTAVALMGSAAVVAMSNTADAAPSPRSAADRRFETLSRRFLDRLMRLSPSNATGTGDHRFDSEIDDVSAAGRASGMRFARETLAAV